MHGLPQGSTRIKDINSRELGITLDNEAKVQNDLERRLLEQILSTLQDVATALGAQPGGYATVQDVLKPDIFDLGSVWVNGAELPVKWAEINATASGDTKVVGMVSGAKIRVIRMDLVVSAAVDVSWKSNVSGGTALTLRNAQSFAANSGMVWPTGPGYYVETRKSEDLYITLGATANVRGAVSYVEVPA